MNRTPSRTRLAYILAPNYSGSTLLTFLLAQHPQLVTVGELKASAIGNVDDYTCSCGSPLRQCEFWADIDRSMKAVFDDFDLQDFGTHFRSATFPCDHLLRATLRGPLFECIRSAFLNIFRNCHALRDRILQRNALMIDTALELQSGAMFLDSSKEPIRLHHFQRSNLWDIKVIRLSRDGRAVSKSIERHRSISFGAAVDRWRKTATEIERCYAALPATEKIDLRYEDLCSDPGNVINQLLVFLDLQPITLKNEIASSSHHVLGNSMRLGSTSDIRLDESWKDKMGESQCRLFEQLAGRQNRQLGYHK